MSLDKTLSELGSIVPSSYTRVVAAEPGEKGKALLFFRDKDSDTVTQKFIPFKPFILLEDCGLLEEVECRITSLDGNAKFAFCAEFEDMASYQKALKVLKKITGITPSSPFAPYKIFSDPAQMLFIAAEFRLFREMSFSEIRRLQFDIETLTTEGFDFPNPKREDDKIAMISMSDSTGWSECLVLDDSFTEKQLLTRFVELVNQRDPDVIEGHNIFKFDLPFVEERAKRWNVKLALGREIKDFGKRPLIKKRASRLSIAERTISYPKYEIFGRHIVDTYHLVQHYDVINRELESFGLKEVAKHFGVAAENRTYVDGGRITELFKTNREELVRYALDDVHETAAIAEILAPSFFYQTQLIPISYQNCVVRGNASRIEAMLLSAYLSEKHSIPVPESSSPYSGALTAAPESGRFENVWHCDVRSLYPSVILAEKLIPSRDELKVYPSYLDKLRSFRLTAKDAEKNAETDSLKSEYNALQTTFKILINSFYGYLGFSRGTFNDYKMADRVTTRGREILRMMLELLEKDGAKIIEMDTDGIYFQPGIPPSSGTYETDKKIIAEMESRIQSILPEGIEVELDAVYPAMFGYKSKNYALLHANGEISITGAALKSRGLEPFQREFLRQMMEYLLRGENKKLYQLLEEYRDAIKNRTLPLEKFAKTETLQESPEKYKQKRAAGKGRRSAAYELASNSNRDYRQGDQVSFYVTGEKKKVSVVDNSILLKDAPAERNENTTYYLGKLEDLFAKFAPFIPESEMLSSGENPLGLKF